MDTQPRWLQRLTALALLVAAAATVFLLAVGPLLERHAKLDEALDHNRELLSRLVSLGERRHVLAQQIDTLQARLQRDGSYLKSSTATLGAAELRDRLKDAVQSFGGVLSSTQSLPVSDDEGFSRATLRINATGPIQFLYGLFYSLEAGTPYLFVENVDISSRRTRRPRRNLGGEENPKLTVRFDVYGYLSPGAM